MGTETACRAIIVGKTRKNRCSASNPKKSDGASHGKRLSIRISITNPESGFPRSKRTFRLPAQNANQAEAGLPDGKLKDQTITEFGNSVMASGALMSAQHIYTNSSLPKLDDEALSFWEKTNAAKRIESEILWLINRANPDQFCEQVPESWWRVVVDLRANCQKEPDSFEFAYFVWTLLSEEGSTIEGI